MGTKDPLRWAMACFIWKYFFVEMLVPDGHPEIEYSPIFILSMSKIFTRKHVILISVNIK